MAPNSRVARGRFDGLLASEVADFLANQKVDELRRIEVEARSGVVTLRGVVRSFYQKQLAQLCQQRIPGIQQLINEIVVQDGEDFVPAAPPIRELEDQRRDSRGLRS